MNKTEQQQTTDAQMQAAAERQYFLAVLDHLAGRVELLDVQNKAKAQA